MFTALFYCRDSLGVHRAIEEVGHSHKQLLCLLPWHPEIRARIQPLLPWTLTLSQEALAPRMLHASTPGLCARMWGMLITTVTAVWFFFPPCTESEQLLPAPQAAGLRQALWALGGFSRCSLWCTASLRRISGEDLLWPLCIHVISYPSKLG